METPIGGADCSQCEWEGNECKKFEPSLNTKVMCPVNCYLPYPDSYYTGDVPKLTDSIMNDPTTVEAQRFINFHIKDANVNPTPGDINKEFRCGTTTLSDDAELPTVPTEICFIHYFLTINIVLIIMVLLNGIKLFIPIYYKELSLILVI